jgi:inhibitor of the pro-sigma K processing machinery
MIGFALPLWGLAVFLIIMAVILAVIIKRVLVNTVLGVLALLAVNWLGASYELEISINLLTVLVSAIFGLAGVGALIILELLGVHIQ